MTYVATIDCGTNSLRLLIAEPGPHGTLQVIERRTEIVRLGQGVDATGAFADEALGRTFAVLDDYARRLADAGIGPNRTRMVATSAARDVSNTEDFLAGAARRIGVRPEVISGEREAQLSFAGAVGSPPIRDALDGVPEDGSVLVVDIGGGSTELVLGARAGRIDAAVSLSMGSVRLTERFLRSSPPTAAELGAATAYVDGLLDTLPRAGLDLGPVAAAIGVAGTVVTVASLSGAAPHDERRLPGSLIPAAALNELVGRLTKLSAEQIRGIRGMHPGRADVITAGALIASRIVGRLGTPGLLVSIADILDGVALEIARDLA